MVINISKIPTANDIPKNWIYKHYLELKEPLDGRRIRLKSVFNNEKSASMFLYVNNGSYAWKDFSSGLSGGSPYTLLKYLKKQETGKNITLKEIIQEVKEVYHNWTEKHGEYIDEELNVEHYAFTTKALYETREWEHYDEQYWQNFYISKESLELYNVKPLKSYTLFRENSDGVIIKMFLKFSTYYSYGYFNSLNELLKIYNPYEVDVKHILLKTDILGSDQLKFEKNNLIICSSLKDLLAMVSFELDCEYVCPIAEKVVIDVETIKFYKKMYKKVFTLFDNDRTGIQAMMLYKQLYDIDFIYIPNYKDIAEFCEHEDYHDVQRQLIPKIDKILNG